MKIWNLILDNEVAMLLVLIGIIQAFKMLVIQRKTITRDEWWIFLVCVIVGVGAGFAYQFTYFGVPADAKTWFNLILFGVGLGVVLPWIYNAAGDIMEKAGKKLAEQLGANIGIQSGTDSENDELIDEEEQQLISERLSRDQES